MRDRTKELKKDDQNSDDDEAAVRLVIREKEDPTAAFFQQVEQIQDGIARVRELVTEMEILQLRILSTPIPEEGQTEQLQKVRDNIKMAASRIQSQLKAIQPQKQDEDSEQFSVDSRIQRTQYSTLSRNYVEVMTSCNTVQSQYRDRNMQRLQRQLKITGVQITEERIEEMLESGQNDVFTANLMQDTHVTRQALNEIEDRHHELLRLEKSISELHELFLLLAMEVESQGEMVDNIESNISNSVNYVDKAKQNTGAAVVSQRKARKKKLCLIVCVSVVLLIIIAIIVVVAFTS